MKKYCLVSFCNIYVLPYATNYIKSIINNKAECDLVFWDRDGGAGRDNYPGCNCIRYSFILNGKDTQIKKICGYIGAYRFISEQLEKNDYAGVVFLQSHAAVAFNKIIRKKYTKKYIVDIRDYSLENFKIYRYIEKLVIQDSFSTVISSPAYVSFLPDFEYTIAHNYMPFSLAQKEDYNIQNQERKKKQIRISFVGTVRFFEMNRKIIHLFANDDRFVICYYGRGSEVLEEYCKKNNIYNIDIKGAFHPDEIIKLYAQTDLINNIYGNNDKFLDYALSNKLYHAAQLQIPILVSPNTYMAEITQKYNIGYVFDSENPCESDKVYEWYNSYDRALMRDGCCSFINNVITENAKFYDMIQDFVDKV